jgi:phospholipid/cholesterol/gamma-HCH transport system substrate-binding protein
VIGRIAALAAIVLAIVVVAFVLLAGGSSYQVKAIFSDASQLVPGDQVEVAGNNVGSVSNIELTPNGLAELTLSIKDSTYQPLHQGTQATVRQASLSGLANRYVDLRIGPANAPAIRSGAVIATQNTTSAVDIDQIFNTLDERTRKGLQDVFQGSASQYGGRGNQAQAGWQYLNPAIASASVLFRELNRDTGRFKNFIVKSANLVTDIAARQADVSGLVSHLSTTFQALAAQNVALGQSIQRLPGFMALADTTFVNLRHALDDVQNLVDVSKPVLPKLNRLLVQLRPLAQDAAPTVKDLSSVIRRPGANNDLIELNQLAVPLATVTVHGVRTNTGAVARCSSPHDSTGSTCRPGAFPESVKSLNSSTPELAIGRPYAADLTGWFEGYTHPGGNDANGGYSRVAPVIGIGSLESGSLDLCSNQILGLIPGCTAVNNLLTNPTQRLAFAQSILTTGQGDRCPGSMERGGVWKPESGFPCNENEVPTGQ